jgi:hypothetical protein
MRGVLVSITDAMALIDTFVPAQAVFDLPADFETFRSVVRGLSRTDTLFWCARINLVLSNAVDRDDVGKQRVAIQQFFGAAEIQRIERFAAAHGGAGRVKVFMRTQLLELMRWACLLAEDLPGDGETFLDPAMRRRFAQAALMASDIWAKRVYQPLVTAREPDWRQSLASFNQSVSLNLPAGELRRALARGTTIYLDGESDFVRKYAPDFQAAMGYSLEEYLACVCNVIVGRLNVTSTSARTDPGGFNIRTIGTHLTPRMAGVLASHLEQESQTADELRAALLRDTVPGDLSERTAYSYKALRERPILRTPAGNAIVLDPAFYTEKATVGPLFKIAALHRKKGTGNEVFGAFGKAFERYVESVLISMYGNSGQGHPLVGRLTRSPKATCEKGSVEIADALLDDATDVVLFETKAVFIKEELFRDDTPGTYLDALREKYGYSEGSQNERLKGVAQLARAIRKLDTKEWQPLALDLRLAERLYPVLIVHDMALGAPGHADFLNQEFLQALEPDEVFSPGTMRKGRFTVFPLVVMTIEDLENLESSVKQFRLVEFLRDYAGTKSTGLRQSLKDFMAQSRKYSFRESEELVERALSTLGRFQAMTFGSSTALE